MNEPAIHIGTSGWSYKHWKELFYPEKLKTTDWLQYYSKFFKVSELNTSFYHLPKPATTEGWKNKVQGDFKFCPKMSRYLTHMKKLNDPEESLLSLFEVFAPLKRKLGPILIQLPPSLHFNQLKAEHLYKLCKTTYSYYKFAMEVRHQSWMEKESISLMKQYNIAFVISQSGVGFPYSELVTAQHIYVRFHGPQQLYASNYSEQELIRFSEMFLDWRKNGHTIWAFFNNDIHGYAVENAMRLNKLCQSN